MRKLGFRRESAELPLPAGTGVGGGAPQPRRTKRQRSPFLFFAAVLGLLLIVLCVAALFGGSSITALHRGHSGTRPALTAEEEQVVEQVRADVLRRRTQSWTSAPPPTTNANAMYQATTDPTPTPLPSSPIDQFTTATALEANNPAVAATITTTALPIPHAPQSRLPILSRQEAAFQFEEPDRLPGLQLHRQSYTPDELMSKFATTDFIYSFANGTESNHQYRKEIRLACLLSVLRAENASYVAGHSTLWTAHPTQAASQLMTVSTGAVEGGLTAQPSAPLSGEMSPFELLGCQPRFMKDGVENLTTLGDLLYKVEGDARKGADNRDRETDELRHSIRSVEQHVGWHRGRVVIVSPGHHPTWVDGAKNFLAGVCGDASVQALRLRGTHLRLTTVHQDAIMPYGMRFTANSHVIEQHIWRVRNTTAVHVYMNDDYFVNRDVAITDLFNEYGGTIVRVEMSHVASAAVGDHTASWAKGVLHTQQFNIQELDVSKEDYLPDGLKRMWSALGRVKGSDVDENALPTIAVPLLDEAVDVAHQYSAEPLPLEPLRARRVRHYATHAPFAYCTNMFRFLETRYEREFANASLHHRGRKARDLFIPFLYNAFVMARPWVASPQFLPYLLQLHENREQGLEAAPPAATISLDNFDGCAPATLLAGANVNGCIFGKFMDNLADNTQFMNQVGRSNPLYFNINAGFNSDAAADQLRQFLHEKFPTPAYLEAPATTTAEEAGEGDEEDHTTVAADTAAADAVLQSLFGQLMALPVVGLVSYEEGVCPLVRSLPLAFAGHHGGRVHVAVQRHGDGESDESLRETRVRLEHRVVSAIPTPLCAYDPRVSVGASARGESVSDAAARVLVDGDGAGVELPATCGGGLAGLRVRGFVVDARTPGAPVASAAALRDALAMPGQTLALEDFRAVRVGPEDGDVVLVLAREDAAARAVHWIGGASENDLLATYPLPVEAYEDMSAPLRWAIP